MKIAVALARQQGLLSLGYYTVGHKKGANLFSSVTLSRINGF